MRIGGVRSGLDYRINLEKNLSSFSSSYGDLKIFLLIKYFFLWNPPTSKLFVENLSPSARMFSNSRAIFIGLLGFRLTNKQWECFLLQKTFLEFTKSLREEATIIKTSSLTHEKETYQRKLARDLRDFQRSKWQNIRNSGLEFSQLVYILSNTITHVYDGLIYILIARTI